MKPKYPTKSNEPRKQEREPKVKEERVVPEPTTPSNVVVDEIKQI